VDETLTVPRLIIYNNYWEEFPPLHVLAAGYLGFKKKETGSFEDLVDTLSGIKQGGIN